MDLKPTVKRYPSEDAEILCIPNWRWIFGNDSAASLAENDLRCPNHHFYIRIIAFAYQFVSIILLVNLLIAMFTYTFDSVRGTVDEKFNFFSVKKSQNRSFLLEKFQKYSRHLRSDTNVEGKTIQDRWDQMRYEVFEQFRRRSILVPPLNLFTDTFLILKGLLSSCR